MKKATYIYILGGLFGLVTLSFKTTKNFQEPWKAPASADTLKSPFPASPPVLREGEKLYNIFCVSCHGPNGLGDGSPGKFQVEPANFHSKEVAAQTEGALFWKLTTGRGRSMPAFAAALPDEKRWQLIAYIRQFAKKGVTVVKVRPVLPLKNYRIDSKIPSQYFALPLKLTNVTNSEFQLFMVDTVVKALVRPWGMVFLPDGRVLIAERGGRLALVRNGKVQPAPIGGNVPKGLRDLKLHPNFSQNKLIYISYYTDEGGTTPGYSVLMRARLEGDKLVDDKVLYKAGPFKGNGEWYGSKIAFDYKGHVFFTVGIKSGRTTAQDLSLPDGKTMRFNDDGSIPTDNPFVNTKGALPEIYTYGHRVHEGLARDPKTGRIFSTEFGELGGDELNVIKAGANYGWPLVSHSLEYNGSIISETPFREGIEAPVHHYAVAPSDLDFVYGNRYPGWNGNIFIGGLAAKMLYRVVLKNDTFSHEERLLENIGRVRDVKMGPDQLLYVLTEDTGLLVRLIPVNKL